MLKTSRENHLYIVLGAGLSGCAATRWLLQRDKEVLLYDANAEQLTTAQQHLRHPLLQVTAQQTQVQQALLQCTELVVSPGFANDHALLVAGRVGGVKICSEVELGLRHYRGKIAAVTGTNGKSTVCAMLHHVLQQAQLTSAMAGNIGTPVTEVLLEKKTTPELLIVELSSFQLEHTQLPPLSVAVFTNFTPAHLSRHGDTDTYFALKQKLFTAIAADGLAICDAYVHTKLTVKPAQLSIVGEKNAGQDHASLLPHDKYNATMALLAAQYLTGISMARLTPHLHNWRALPHRLQLVGHLDGHAVIDDSKATDIAATCAALKAQSAPVLLILGCTAAMAQQLLPQKNKIAGILACGVHSTEVYAQLHHHCPTQHYASLAALLDALPGTHLSAPLLFSPACASQPEFANFERRGMFFQERIAEIEGYMRVSK